MSVITQDEDIKIKIICKEYRKIFVRLRQKTACNTQLKFQKIMLISANAIFSLLIYPVSEGTGKRYLRLLMRIDVCHIKNAELRLNTYNFTENLMKNRFKLLL